jgi:hypothetical protein
MPTDNNLIFAILSAIGSEVTNIYSHLEERGYNEQQVTEHLILLQEGSHIDGLAVIRFPGGSPVTQMVSPLRLRSRGRDYLQLFQN